MNLTRLRATTTAMVAAGALVALATTGGAAAASTAGSHHRRGNPARYIAHSSASCSTQWTNRHGYAYLYRLSVSHTSCSSGAELAAHHGHLHGWRCKTKRLATSAVQYMDRQSCSSGRRRVSWEFSENR